MGQPVRIVTEGVCKLDDSRKRKLIKEELFTEPSIPGDEPQLIGSKCTSCGEVFFPRRRICTNCQNTNLEEIKLSQRGKIYSFTVVTQRPPEYYKGSVPYAFGYVELAEGVRVQTLFTGCDLDALKIGMDVKLVIEKLYEDDEGNEIIAYKFRPVKA